MKIGQLVKNYVPHILVYCEKQDKDELLRLMDKEYSNKIFGINFPFCADVNSAILNSKRFWKDKYLVNDKTIRVSSQWTIKHKTKFLDYLLQLQLINKTKHQELDQLVQHVQKQTDKATIIKPLKIITQESSSTNLMTYFNKSLLDEASIMTVQYEKFYCLERSIRLLVKKVMFKSYKENWWNKVDIRVRDNVQNNLEYELDTSHTKRSEHKIDYTTFGDLRKIINTQWEIFKPNFNRNLNSVNEVMIDLNRIRVSIAHCTPLAIKEIKRLDIRIDDWYDLFVNKTY